MHSADLAVLEAALAWLDEGRRVALATVVGTFGSAPRPLGALLALSDDGRLEGSVSGGCVEQDLLDQAGRGFPHAPELLRYGVTTDEARRFGLPCGGSLDLVLEPLAGRAALAPIAQAIGRRRLMTRVLDLETGEVRVTDGGTEPGCRFDGRRLTRVFGPRWRLLIIGAGQIARFVADLARGLDYQVLLCDPREEYARSWTGEGEEWRPGMPDDVVRELAPDARSVVVALTHDPKLDDLALLAALASDAFYVGALGAKANQAKRRQRLLDLGLSEAQVERLHGPVGRPLGGKTPPEIALAILAEVTALRHGVHLLPP